MQRYYGLKGSALNITIGFIAGLDFLLFGYDQGVTGGLLKLASFQKQFPEINPYNYQCPDAKTVASQYDCPQGDEKLYQKYSNYQGCFLGACCCIWLGNILGRKRTIFTGSSIMIVGAILQCAAFRTPQFIVGRIVTGFGNGLNTSTVPTWQSETSKSHRRGQLVMLEGSLITAGVMISYWIDFGFYFIGEQSVAWRFPLAFQIFFALIIVCVVLGLPESPRWLILKGREDEALEVLEALNNTSRDDKYIQNEFTSIKETVLEMSRGSFRDLFTMHPESRHLHRTVLAYVNQMFQQISGVSKAREIAERKICACADADQQINLITYYAPVIYTTIGLSGYLPSLLTACNGTEYFLSSLIAIAVIEKIGRRKLMLFGAAGMSLGMVALTISTKFSDQGNQSAGVSSAFFLFFFNTCFALGWLGMTWLYPAEIVPLRIRAPANALSTTANWLFNFTVVMISPPAFANIGYQTYIIFAVINAFIFPVVYFFYPETKLRSLEEMDMIFAKSGWFSCVRNSINEPYHYDKEGQLLIPFDQEEYRRYSRTSFDQEKGGEGDGTHEPPSSDENLT
ncbi:MAG: hypothetical protein Q9159_006490 [Coniocarpon cinnabarinum]